ncbi:hypothetical protein L3C95_25540 [Chitinophaga filiformis]|uniref:hypothetical protein n=1 Tax=Chitinophaga filiformis TaxID=104663 RepID=UPI001F38F23F|nr:hypothetical protein [Chitinophaga filiformis]MCF6406284.1 hypothetical protein [Chitinophaga filiformis]
MKKILQLIILLFSFQQLASAQFKVLAEGPAFNEPEEGFGRLLLLKNGGTVLTHIHREQKEGIEVQIYNKEHVQTAIKHIVARPGGNYDHESVNNIFEINGDLTILITALIEKKPTLFRMIVNATTGELTKMEKIAEAGKQKIDRNHPLRNPFLVRKDPLNDYYAVAISHDKDETWSDERIEVVLYNSRHAEISRARYAAADNKYSLLQLHDLVVYNGGTVGLLGYGDYHNDATNRREGHLVLMKLEKNEHTLMLTEPGIMKGHQIDGGIIRHNPVTGKLILLGCALVNDEPAPKTKKKAGELEVIRKQYLAFAAFANPTAMNIEKTFDVFPTEASERSKKLYKCNCHYHGMPQNLFLNADGGFSIVYEDLFAEHYIAPKVGTANQMGDLNEVMLRDVAVSTFDRDGVIKTSTLIPKEHRLEPSWLENFYHSRRDNTGNELLGGLQFKSFSYLNSGNKNYILLNDTERNIDELKVGKKIPIIGVGKCDAFYYPVDGKNTLPDRQYLFENEKRNYKLAAFTISDYDQVNNIYVTMQIETKTRGKNTKIIWLRP